MLSEFHLFCFCVYLPTVLKVFTFPQGFPIAECQAPYPEGQSLFIFLSVWKLFIQVPDLYCSIDEMDSNGMFSLLAVCSMGGNSSDLMYFA